MEPDDFQEYVDEFFKRFHFVMVSTIGYGVAIEEEDCSRETNELVAKKSAELWCEIYNRVRGNRPDGFEMTRNDFVLLIGNVCRKTLELIGEAT